MLSRAQLGVAASIGFVVMSAWLAFLKPDPAALLANSQRTQFAAIENKVSAAEAPNSLQPVPEKSRNPICRITRHYSSATGYIKSLKASA
jgi:hypothetical protein